MSAKIPEPMHAEIWLQCPNRDSMSEWYGEVTWAEDPIHDDDTKYVRADLFDAVTKQRDQAWEESRSIREAINANPEESTLDEVRRVIKQRKDLLAALENCRLLAARHRKEEWANNVLRFCSDAGVVSSPIREQALSSVKESA